MFDRTLARHPSDPPRQGASIGAELLLSRLRRLTPLAGEEIALVLSLIDGMKTHAAGAMIAPRPDGSPSPRLIVSGWACRPRILADGRRQMLGLVLPGDLIGDRGGRRPLALNPVMALTTVRSVSASRLFETLALYPNTHPQLRAALDEADRLEEAQLLDHVVRLGCQTALQRTAHCLLELHTRLGWIGFTHDNSFPMPLTQDTLGDLLGLSLVHVNRILAQLKREALVRIRSGVAIVDDFSRLALLADRSDPTGTPVSG